MRPASCLQTAPLKPTVGGDSREAVSIGNAYSPLDIIGVAQIMPLHLFFHIVQHDDCRNEVDHLSSWQQVQVAPAVSSPIPISVHAGSGKSCATLRDLFTLVSDSNTDNFILMRYRCWIWKLCMRTLYTVLFWWFRGKQSFMQIHFGRSTSATWQWLTTTQMHLSGKNCLQPFNIGRFSYQTAKSNTCQNLPAYSTVHVGFCFYRRFAQGYTHSSLSFSCGASPGWPTW